VGRWVKCAKRMPVPFRQVWTNNDQHIQGRHWCDERGLWRAPCAHGAHWNPISPPTMWYDDDDAQPEPPKEESDVFGPCDSVEWDWSLTDKRPTVEELEIKDGELVRLVLRRPASDR